MNCLDVQHANHHTLYSKYDKQIIEITLFEKWEFFPELTPSLRFIVDFTMTPLSNTFEIKKNMNDDDDQ